MKVNNAFIQSQRNLVERLYSEGVSIKEIVEQSGISDTSLNRWINKWDIQRNREGKFQKTLDKIADSEIVEKYKELRAVIATAAFYGVKVANIRKVLKRNGLDGNRDWLPEEAKRAMIALYDQNISMNDIAAQYGIHRRTLRMLLERWGVKRKVRTTLCHRIGKTEEEIVAKFDELNSVHLTAEHFGGSPMTIRKIIAKHGRKNSQEKATDWIVSNKQYIIDQYKSGVSGHEIGKALDIAGDTVYQYLHKFGVKINPCHGFNTSIERRMKELMENIGLVYRFQFEIRFGSTRKDKYVYDFLLPEYNLIIEVNGDYWHGNPKLFSTLNEIQVKTISRDKLKMRLARRSGYEVLRIWENKIQNSPEEAIEMVLKKIDKMSIVEAA